MADIGDSLDDLMASISNTPIGPVQTQTQPSNGYLNTANLPPPTAGSPAAIAQANARASMHQTQQAPGNINYGALPVTTGGAAPASQASFAPAGGQNVSNLRASFIQQTQQTTGSPNYGALPANNAPASAPVGGQPKQRPMSYIAQSQVSANVNYGSLPVQGQGQTQTASLGTMTAPAGVGRPSVSQSQMTQGNPNYGSLPVSGPPAAAAPAQAAQTQPQAQMTQQQQPVPGYIDFSKLTAAPAGMVTTAPAGMVSTPPAGMITTAPAGMLTQAQFQQLMATMAANQQVLGTVTAPAGSAAGSNNAAAAAAAAAMLAQSQQQATPNYHAIPPKPTAGGAQQQQSLGTQTAPSVMQQPATTTNNTTTNATDDPVALQYLTRGPAPLQISSQQQQSAPEPLYLSALSIPRKPTSADDDDGFSSFQPVPAGATATTAAAAPTPAAAAPVAPIATPTPTPAPAATAPTTIMAPATAAPSDFGSDLDDLLGGLEAMTMPSSTPASTQTKPSPAPTPAPAKAVAPGADSLIDDLAAMFDDDAFPSGAAPALAPAPTPAPTKSSTPAPAFAKANFADRPISVAPSLSELDAFFAQEFDRAAAVPAAASPAPAPAQPQQLQPIEPIRPGEPNPGSSALDRRGTRVVSLAEAEELLGDVVSSLTPPSSIDGVPLPHRKPSITISPRITPPTSTESNPKPNAPADDSGPAQPAEPNYAAMTPAEAMQKQQQIMMQMGALQSEFLQFQNQQSANPGSIPAAQAQQQMMAFQNKLKELSEQLQQINNAQKKNAEAAAPQALPPAMLIQRPSSSALPIGSSGSSGPNPNAMSPSALPPPKLQVPTNLSGPLPITTNSLTNSQGGGGVAGSPPTATPGGAAPKVATIAPPVAAPKSPATTSAAAAPRAANGMLKTGPLLKLGGKKAFGHKWQLRKCCVLTTGDMEWYDADPNDPAHVVFKGKMTLKGSSYKDIDNGHPDFQRLRKIGHKNIPKDNPDFMSFFSLYSSNKNKTYFFAVPLKYREGWKKAITDVSK